MRKLASHDRSTLIRLASTMPKGNVTRRAILAGLSRLAEEGEGEAKPKPKGKGPGKDFIEYMKEVWDGGKKKVSNPNPESRKTYPEVAVSTAMKDKKSSTYKQVMDGFKKWTEEKKNKDKDKDKSDGKKTEEKGEKEESGNKGKENPLAKMDMNQLKEVYYQLDDIAKYAKAANFMPLISRDDDFYDDPNDVESWLDKNEGGGEFYVAEDLVFKNSSLDKKKDTPHLDNINANVRKLFKPKPREPKLAIEQFIGGLRKDIDKLDKKFRDPETGEVIENRRAEEGSKHIWKLYYHVDALERNLEKMVPKYHELNKSVVDSYNNLKNQQMKGKSWNQMTEPRPANTAIAWTMVSAVEISETKRFVPHA